MNVKEHYKRLIEIEEEFIPYLWRNQMMNKSSRDYGGYVLPSKGYSEPAQSAKCFDILISLYYNGDSRYFHDDHFLERAELYLDNLLREQHTDGTIDLKETNFHDATAVAFTVQVLAYTYRLMEKLSSGNKEEDRIQAKLYQYLQQGGEGMREGGFHTPNHRWVMASALALVYRITGDERLKEEAEKYLREGIDCDEDGEYTERSAGVYNVVNNNSLLILAEELNKPELLDAVDRNLKMVLCYIEPDDTLYTLNSRRQDYGKKVYPVNYYWNYLSMAYRRKNGQYAYMADHLLKLYREKHCFHEEALRNDLTRLMLQPDMVNQTLQQERPADSYERWFPNSGVIRMRNKRETWTLLAHNTRFLKYQNGENSVYMKLAASFFGDKGRFIPSEIQRIPGGYALKYRMEWGYVRPFEEPSETSVWEDMDHNRRIPVQMQLLDVKVEVYKKDGGILVSMASAGTEGVPYKLEFIFNAGGFLETEDAWIPGREGNSVLLKKGKALYTYQYDSITIGEGQSVHHYTDAMRGSEPAEPEKFTLYMTGYTPIHNKLVLSREPAAWDGKGS